TGDSPSGVVARGVKRSRNVASCPAACRKDELASSLGESRCLRPWRPILPGYYGSPSRETTPMRGRRPQALTIAPEDDQPLRRPARSHGAPWFQVRRARIVLAVAGGERVQAIAASIRCDPATVRRTCRRYCRLGLDGLLAPPQRP